MKKLFFIASAFCFLISCGGAQTSNQSNDSKIDSTSNQVEEQAPVAEQKADPFTMVDGKVFDLKSNVKKAVTYGYYSDDKGNPQGSKAESEVSIEFQDGKVIKHSEFFPDGKFVRSNNGQLEKMTWFCSDFAFDFETSFTYNENGFPIAKKEINLGGGESTMKYNAENELVEQTTLAQYEEGQEGKIIQEFQILEKDEKQNWTKRLVKINEGLRDDDQSDYQWQKSNWVEIRKIEY